MKKLTVEQRYPTKKARELADEAIDALSESDSMTLYIDTWLAAYKAAGGMEKKRG